MTEPLGLARRPDSWINRAAPGAVAAAGAIAIALWNPGDAGVSICVSKRFFGVDCPLCGGLRCVNSLMRGDFLAAADHNVILALALPVVAIVWLAWLIAPLSGRQVEIRKPPQWVLGLGALLVATFTVIRNVGGPTWVQWLASGTFH